MDQLKPEPGDNISSVFEYPFDFQRYIEERLREIPDPEERRVAKIVLAEGLGTIIQCAEEKYQALERQVYEEIEIPGNCYEICSTIVQKAQFDPADSTLFPVCGEDLDAEALTARWSDGTKLYLETVYFELSERDLRCLKQNGLFLKGNIRGGDYAEAVTIEIRPSLRYREIVEELYHVFQDNGVMWNTVNTAYLDKFFDVFVCLGSKNLSSAGRVIQEAEFSMGKWEASVRRGMIPLWNVQKILFKSASFLMPCADGIHYEHEFVPEHENGEDGYLIQRNEDILGIRQDQGRIILRSRRGTFDGWVAYRIAQAGPDLSRNDSAPILTNRKKDSFLRRYGQKTQRRLLTKSELLRKILELEISDYLEIYDYQICENKDDFPVTEGMNWFIRDELFPMDSRKILLFLFKERKPGFYLNDAIMRFAVSQMQLELNEYRCVGEIR